MRPVVTAAQARALDRATIDEIGLPGAVLMETAGRAVAEVALRMLEEDQPASRPARRIAVVCGPGNNGGDGWVIARVLRARGVEAIAYLAAPPEALTADARLHLDALIRSGGVVHGVATAAALAAHRAAIGSADLVVDALFGVGLTRAVTGHLAEVIGAMAEARRRLAVDLPSGLDTDTGVALGAAVVADVTVTMAALKPAVCGAPGVAHAGRVEVAEIGIPAPRIAEAARAAVIELADVRAALPRVSTLDYKGRRGHVAVIGGGPGMRGAGRLAARAALRAGAGLCTLAADGPGELLADDAVMTWPLDPVAADPDARLAALVAGKQAVVIGCGLVVEPPATIAAWRRLAHVLAAGVPAVIDAGALALLAAHPDARPVGPCVITPHPGEAARLLGVTAAAVERDRLAAARTLATRTGAVVVLKGARTVICVAGDDFCTINPTGGPALSTGGSGDVLAGTIGGLLAQGLTALDAARVGVYLHGLAGEALGRAMGRGAIASDLPEAIAREIAALS